MSKKPSVDAIFCAAIEIDSADQRQSYLHRTCGEDAELRRQVERLLQAHYRGGSIMDAPAHALFPTLDQPPLEQPGSQIGPYKLLQEIGEGGMGVVYMAEQTEPDPPQGRAQDHQARHGHPPGDRPLRGRSGRPCR